MRHSAVHLISLAFLLGATAGGGDLPTTFYVQLIRGTDSAGPAAAGWKRIGPRLAKTLNPVFRWKGYWEVDRQKVVLLPGQKSRVRLSHNREAEIDLSHPSQRRVAAFKNGQLVDRTTSPAGDALTIIGGNLDARSVWFIVVRRDQPGLPN